MSSNRQGRANIGSNRELSEGGQTGHAKQGEKVAVLLAGVMFSPHARIGPRTHRDDLGLTGSGELGSHMSGDVGAGFVWRPVMMP